MSAVSGNVASKNQQASKTNRAGAKQSGASEQSGSRSVAQSLQEYGRGVAGGILFSLPLLYTMEVWWAGHNLYSWQLVAGLLATYVLLLGYNRYAGLRRDASFIEVAIDSVEELGIGVVVAAGVLWMIGRITSDMPLNEIAGKVVLESFTVAIGVSVGTAQLGASGAQGTSDDDAKAGDDSDDGAGDDAQDDAQSTDFFGEIVLAFCGAILIAGNIAPTEEVIMIAVEVTSWRLFAMVVVSLLLSALILFYSDFSGSNRLADTNGFLNVASRTAVSYVVALAASALVLWFFGSFDGFGLATRLSEVIVLGVGASLGSSAGRLLLQSSGGGS